MSGNRNVSQLSSSVLVTLLLVNAGILAPKCQGKTIEPAPSAASEQFAKEIQSAKVAERMAALDRLGVDPGLHTKMGFESKQAVLSLSQDQRDYLLREVAKSLTRSASDSG